MRVYESVWVQQNPNYLSVIVFLSVILFFEFMPFAVEVGFSISYSYDYTCIVRWAWL